MVKFFDDLVKLSDYLFMKTSLLPAHLQRRDTASAISVFGVEVQILASSAQTDGSASTYLATCAPGVGAPPHRHINSDETFYVLEGAFEILCGESIQHVSSGDLVFIPRGVAHHFQCTGPQTGRLLGFCQPAGHEKFFLDCAEAVTNGTFSPETGRAICVKHGIELLIPH
jgi:mannose-6-phosphate isomerase-like protein (cupin superfamily)